MGEVEVDSGVDRDGGSGGLLNITEISHVGYITDGVTPSEASNCVR